MNARFLYASLFSVMLLIATTPTFVGARPLPTLPLFLPQSGFAVVDLSQQVVNEGLLVTYKFNRSVAALVRSQLSYRKVASTGSSGGQVPFETPAPNNMTFSFKIPRSEFEGADRIEFQVNLINAAGTTVYASQPSSFALGFYKSVTEQAKKATERANALDTKILSLYSEIAGLTTQLAAASNKYESAQRSLNSVTRGLEPERVNLLETNLVTDGRIVLTFTTEAGVPGRIKATIEGPNGFSKAVVSDNLSTQHITVFDGLLPSTPYRIKAVALRLEDRAEIPSSVVNEARDNRLAISTKAPFSPPVASFTVTPSHDRMKVTVNSDQKVFAEITYQPLDAAGTLIETESKQIGSIRQDEFGAYSGDQVVNANAPEDFTLPDLKENTQYRVFVKLVNELGKTPSNLLDKHLRTTVKPTPFDFTKVTNVQMSPIGVKVMWNSTTKATGARLQVVYEGDDTASATSAPTVTVDKVAAINGNVITANIDGSDVIQMIVKNKVPILRLSMTDGNGPAVQRDLQVTFVLPKNSEVQGMTSLGEPVRSALLDVTGKIEKGKGVDWKKVLTSGLSMLVRSVLPIP